MAKNIIGIDISDFSMEALSLEKSKGSFRIESHSRFRLSPEIVEDGQIIDSKKLKDAILKMFQNAKPEAFDNSRKVFLSIPESKTFSKVLSLPKSINEKELTKVALNRAEETIPESTDNLASVVKILPHTEDNYHVFYSAAEIDILKSFVTVFKELDIEVAGITTETISSFAGLKREKDKKNTLLLDLGARTTIASIFRDNCLCSSINIDIGGDNITKSLMEKLNISYQQAEDKKRQIGLSSEDGDGETMLISQGQLQPLVDELKIFIKYWQDKNNQTLEKVILIGGLSQMKGADKYFGDNLNLSAELGQPFIDAKNIPAGLPISKYINALGLAKIGHKGTDIDFYKKLSKEKKSDKKRNSSDGSSKDDKKNGASKKIDKKNIIYIALIIILFLLAGAIFLFRNQLTNLVYPQDEPVGVVEDILPEEPDVPKALEISEVIYVSTEENSDRENFIPGELYDLEIEKIVSDPELSYQELITSLQESEEIVNQVNDIYEKIDYYIVPVILESEILSTEPEELLFVEGNELKATISYRFLSFKESDLDSFLDNKYPEIKGEMTGVYYINLDSYIDEENYALDLKATAKFE